MFLNNRGTPLCLYIAWEHIVTTKKTNFSDHASNPNPFVTKAPMPFVVNIICFMSKPILTHSVKAFHRDRNIFKSIINTYCTPSKLSNHCETRMSQVAPHRKSKIWTNSPKREGGRFPKKIVKEDKKSFLLKIQSLLELPPLSWEH